VLIPGSDDTANDAMRRACMQQDQPGRILAVLPKNAGPDELSLPLFAERLHTYALPQAFVCRDDYCSLAAQSVEDLERTLLSMTRGAAKLQ
jgi:uncharacterized protein YyaL (SSP411 family)